MYLPGTTKRKEGRNLVEWTDTIPKNSVILFDFQLIKSNSLRKATVEHLKYAYANLDDFNFTTLNMITFYNSFLFKIHFNYNLIIKTLY